MKKILVLMFAMLLMMCVALPACAVSAQLSSTQDFLKEMDERGITYTVLGLDDEGENERVKINNTDDNDFSYTINLFFDKNEENCSIRVWNIITFSDADFSKVLRTCNTVNSEYKYLKFYVDESDNTITASIDLIYRENDVGAIVTEAILHVASILEKTYPTLAVYDK